MYLVINTIYGTNSIGRAGPSGTSEVFAVDLDQVSTILPGKQITRQLTLDDLHTDCPQSLDPGVVATTIPDGHCDFSLLAPETVKQWALPVSKTSYNSLSRGYQSGITASVALVSFQTSHVHDRLLTQDKVQCLWKVWALRPAIRHSYPWRRADRNYDNNEY